MEYKYSFMRFIFLQVFVFINMLLIYLSFDKTFWLYEMYLLLSLIVLQGIHIISLFFRHPLLISNSEISKVGYFRTIRINLSDVEQVNIEPFLGFLRKRILIITKDKTLVLWNFYNISLWEIRGKIRSTCNNKKE